MRREFHVRFCEGGRVRFPSATRLIVGFQHESDTQRFWDDMRKRFEEFSLSLNPDKTRLIESAALQGNDALSVGLASRRPSTSSASPSSANATDVSNYS